MDDEIKFAIFTDTHIGYKEHDKYLGNDTFDTFDEILGIAQNEEVDAILHSGDLFEELAPQRTTLMRAMEILKNHCLGSPSTAEIINDYGSISRINSQDPNLQVSIPFFVIHGNHDAPSGFGLTCAAELLQTAGLVNYFAKIDKPDAFELNPVLIRKGNIDVYVYGLGYLSQSKFIGALSNHLITFNKPERSGATSFYILLLHQDRPQRITTQISTPELLAQVCPWMDLLIWGHEHENRIRVEKCAGLNITQPGSSVNTTNREYETKDKEMIILTISENGPDFNYIRLRSPRPFVYRQFVLDAEYSGKTAEQYLDLLRTEINDMIDVYENTEIRPSIHLNLKIKDEVDFSGVNYKALYYEYEDKIANADKSMINISTKKTKRAQDQSSVGSQPKNNASEVASTVEKMIEDKLNESPLQFLTADTLIHSLSSFVHHYEGDAFNRYINELFTVRINALIEKFADETKAFTPEEAEQFIVENRDALPDINHENDELTSRLSTYEMPTSASNHSEDTQSQEPLATKGKRKQKATEDLEPPPPDRSRPKRKTTRSLQIKK